MIVPANRISLEVEVVLMVSALPQFVTEVAAVVLAIFTPPQFVTEEVADVGATAGDTTTFSRDSISFFRVAPS